jgi:hypothetical protein
MGPSTVSEDIHETKSEEIKTITERSIHCLVESMRQGKGESLVQYLRMV